MQGLNDQANTWVRSVLLLLLSALGVGCGGALMDTDAREQAELEAIRAEHRALIAEADATRALPAVEPEGLTSAERRRHAVFTQWAMQQQARASEYAATADDCDLYAGLTQDPQHKFVWQERANFCRIKAIGAKRRALHYAELANGLTDRGRITRAVAEADADAAMRANPPRQSPQAAVLPLEDNLAALD